MNVIKKSRVRNIDQNFADVTCRSPEDGVKSSLAGAELFGISCVLCLVSWEADGSWFNTRSLRQQGVVSVWDLNMGSGCSGSFSRQQKLPVSGYTKGVLDNKLWHCLSSAELLLDQVSQGSSQRQRLCQELVQFCSQSVGMKTLSFIWGFLPFPCGFYTCNLDGSPDWASFFRYLKLIYSSLAALFFFPSGICARISSFDTCVCIWCSEMSGKHKETSLSAKTIAEPSSVVKKGLFHHRILYYNN